LLKDFPDVTGVVAANDLLALGCIDALAARGLCCPADVSVVGYNDVPLMDRMAPPLTTVRIDQHQLGVHAARLLLELIKTPDPRPRTVILPTRLVVRGSTAEPRSDGRARAGARKPVVYRT
jgi:LacI family transcriptional regulator